MGGKKFWNVFLNAETYTIQVPRCLEEEGKPLGGSRVMQTYSSYSLIIQQIVGCLIKRLLFFRDMLEFGMRGTKKIGDCLVIITNGSDNTLPAIY